MKNAHLIFSRHDFPPQMEPYFPVTTARIATSLATLDPGGVQIGP
jgi:hypothetical protein